MLRDGPVLRVDGTEFVLAFRAESTASTFYIAKEPELIDVYLGLADELSGGNIVELGIFGGGSTALLSLIASPRRLVAVDLADEPVVALRDFVAARRLADVVRPHYGVDQADAERLGAIVAAEFGDEELDLVIDDASHHLGPSVASFELLFPRLRPGGAYVIEDWNWASRAVSTLTPADLAANRDSMRAQSLEPLVLDLVLARAAGVAGVGSVAIDGGLVLVRRAAGDLDRPFRLHRSLIDPLGFRPEA